MATIGACGAGLLNTMTKHPLPLILASGSRGRRYLLEREGYAFDVCPADIDEPSGAGCADIRHFVHNTAWLKAAAVAPRFAEGLVLAADTVGWIDGQVIGKPTDADDARRILRTLGGREHELWTGVVLWRRPDDVQVAWQEMARVFVHDFSGPELETYLKTRQWEGCSGAYAIKEEGDPFVKVVQGSVSNVVGLPMESLARALAEHFRPGA
jgi:septum formation protein